MEAIIKEVQLRGVFITNCYFFISLLSNSGFIIDPAAQPDRILDIIRREGWKIERILLTHGHFDHTGAVQVLSEALRIPYYIYPDDDRYLTDPYLNLSGNYGLDVILRHPDFFNDNEIIRSPEDSRLSLKVIHTPGHTPGSVTFYSASNKVAFVGDTLYEHGPGLTNFPGGNPRDLAQSIINKIFTLPDDTVLLSGHSSPITVGEEKRLML